MRILHTIASMQKSSGGPSYMLARLCDRLDEQGASVQVVQSLKVRTSEDVELHNQRITVHNVPTADLSAKLEAIVREIQPDVIHTHGLWLPINRASSAVAAKLNIPLVWTTHGMLRPWALNHKKWKKKLAWWLYQRPTTVGSQLAARYLCRRARGTAGDFTEFKNSDCAHWGGCAATDRAFDAPFREASDAVYGALTSGQRPDEFGESD